MAGRSSRRCPPTRRRPGLRPARAGRGEPPRARSSSPTTASLRRLARRPGSRRRARRGRRSTRSPAGRRGRSSSAAGRCSSRRSRSARGSSSSVPSRSPIPLVAPRQGARLRDRRHRRPAGLRHARAVPDVDRLVVGWPDEVADEIGLGPADAVAVLTHDVKFDEPAIVAALRRGCRYVGAVGSRKTQADRRARLLAAGVSQDELAGCAARSGSTSAVARRPRRRSRSWPRSSPSGTAARAGRCSSWRSPAPDAVAGRSDRCQAGRFGAVVLAAGAGSRFGGGKLLAPLDGRPILQHVLDALRAAGLGETSSCSATAPTAIEARRSPGAASGGSSTRSPSAACRARSRSASRRSRTDRPDGRRRARRARRPATGRSGGRSARSPQAEVRRRHRVRRPALRRRRRREPGARPAAPGGSLDRRGDAAIAGSDRSWPPIPELVAEVESAAPTRDVDTRGRDLRRDRLGRRGSGATGSRSTVIREVPDGADFYAPGHQPLPGRPAADRRAGRWTRCSRWPSRARRGSTSAPGAGRYALPLALRRRARSIADRAVATACGRRCASSRPSTGSTNVRVVAGRWPARPASSAAGPCAPTSRSSPTSATTSRRSARSSTRWRRRPGGCASRCSWTASPASIAEPFWPPIHGEARIRLPALACARRPARGARARAVRRTVRPGAAPVRLVRRPPWVHPPPALAGRGRREGSPACRAAPCDGRGARRDLVRDAGPADDRGRELATRRRLTASFAHPPTEAPASANFVDACMTPAYARRTTLRAAPGSRGRA